MTVSVSTRSKLGSSNTQGLLLLTAAALCWSLGGTISRFLEVTDNWTIVFWRGLFAGAFIFAFMLVREGLSETLRSFRDMGLPGLGVALCFASATISFIIALSHTTVAKILLMQAATPLIAALLGWAFLRQRVDRATWIAIGVVVAGVTIMVSGSLSGAVSPIGDGLALYIAVVFAVAIVLTRRFANVKMIPATCLGVLIGAMIGLTQASHFMVSTADFGFLLLFGAVNLGLGLAFFSIGARLIPAAVAALISTIEPVVGPIWVWLIHDEVPEGRTIAGGLIILAAIVGHVLWQAANSRQNNEA